MYLIEIKDIDKDLTMTQKEKYIALVNKYAQQLIQTEPNTWQLKENVHGYFIAKNLNSNEICFLKPLVSNNGKVKLGFEAFHDSMQELLIPTIVQTHPRSCTNKFQAPQVKRVFDVNGSYISYTLRKRNEAYKKGLFDEFIPLSQKLQVNEADLRFVLSYRPVYNKGRIVINRNKKMKNLARLIYANHHFGAYDDALLPAGLVIDHIDRNPFNNRIHNLRLVTQLENIYNTELVDKKFASGTYYGIYIKKLSNGQYEAKVPYFDEYVTGKIKETRLFDDLLEAKNWQQRCIADNLRALESNKKYMYLNKRVAS